MEKLDIVHHKLIVLAIILVVFLTGLFFGVKISGATRGTDGMQIMIFALCFLNVAMAFIIFSQLVHLRDDNDRLHEEQNTLLGQKTGRKR